MELAASRFSALCCLDSSLEGQDGFFEFRISRFPNGLRLDVQRRYVARAVGLPVLLWWSIRAPIQSYHRPLSGSEQKHAHYFDSPEELIQKRPSSASREQSNSLNSSWYFTLIQAYYHHIFISTVHFPYNLDWYASSSRKLWCPTIIVVTMVGPGLHLVVMVTMAWYSSWSL